MINLSLHNQMLCHQAFFFSFDLSPVHILIVLDLRIISYCYSLKFNYHHFVILFLYTHPSWKSAIFWFRFYCEVFHWYWSHFDFNRNPWLHLSLYCLIGRFACWNLCFDFLLRNLLFGRLDSNLYWFCFYRLSSFWNYILRIEYSWGTHALCFLYLSKELLF